MDKYTGFEKLGEQQKTILRHCFNNKVVTLKSLKGALLYDLYDAEGKYLHTKKDRDVFKSLSDFLQYQKNFAITEKYRTQQNSTLHRSIRSMIASGILLKVGEFYIINPQHL